MINQNEETREAPYVPSARKSIHNHDSCIFSSCADMGRYGVKTNQEVKTTRSSPPQQGTDEVDNVMSKFVRQTSPVPLRQRDKRKERRNSLSTSEPDFSDDDDSESNLLAKSLPANLPSYYSSNNYLNRPLPSDVNNGHKSTSFSENRIRTHMNNSNEYSQDEYSTSASFEQYNERNQSTQKSEGGKSCFQLTIALIIAISSIAAGLYYRGGFDDLNHATHKSYDELRFYKDMNDLGEKYKIKDNTILEVQSGISTILQRNDTGSFIFLYNKKSHGFNYLKFSNFIQDIASTAARFLRNDSKSNHPTVLHGSELNMQSHSELMSKYRHEVAKTGVLLVKDVDRIPSSLAMAFHYFCDEYNPLVAKSAIFFTLNLANCSNLAEQKSSHYDVEKCLANRWHTVPKDNIKPLLARVVNVVIDVTNVN